MAQEYWCKRENGVFGHEGHVNSVAFSSDGKTIASASSDRTTKLWDVSALAEP